MLNHSIARSLNPSITQSLNRIKWSRKMIRKYLLPALAMVGVLFAVYSVVTGSREQPPAIPAAEPASAPFVSYVAGAGLVEAATENIAIGTHVPGVVTDVLVSVGSDVTKGQPLFRLDSRELSAELAVRQGALATAQSKLSKLRSLPRPEDIPPAQARVA